MRLVLIVEARADENAAKILAKRIFVESDVDWIDDTTLSNLLQWTGLESQDSTRWKDLDAIARQHRVKAHGRGLGPDGAAARKALLLIMQANKVQNDAIEAVVLVRDMDNQPERRTSMENVRAEFADKLAFEVVIAAPDPKREAWILHGYEPQNSQEKARLADIRKRLSFDPVISPERLHGDRRQDVKQQYRDIKSVVKCLTQDNFDRERQCLETTPLSLLKERGQRTGLADYLDEVTTRLLPLLDPGANASVAKGVD